MEKKDETERLRNHVSEIYKKYNEIDEKTASVIMSGDKWSIKEIFGHLIDSAANNYQRFIRLQESKSLSFPAYDYNWIKIIKYNSYSFNNIIELWKQYNLLLCHIILNIDDSSLMNCWIIDDNSLTLKFLISDYIDHMEIHLKQLDERLKEVYDYIEERI